MKLLHGHRDGHKLKHGRANCRSGLLWKCSKSSISSFFLPACLQCVFSFLALRVETKSARQLSILHWNDKVIDIDYLEAIHSCLKLQISH